MKDIVKVFNGYSDKESDISESNISMITIKNFDRNEVLFIIEKLRKLPNTLLSKLRNREIDVSNINIDSIVFLYTLIHICIVSDFMATTIRINEDIKQQLKLKSAQTGISQLDLPNKYILNGLKNDNSPNKKVMTLDQIEKFLEHDKPEGDTVLEELDGIVHSDIKTNAVDLKKNSYK